MSAARRQPFLPSTAWQVWTCAVLDAIDDARAELDARELEALLDVVAAKIAYLYIARLGLLDAHEQDAA